MKKTNAAKIDWVALRRAAEGARKHSHSPYSRYPVGAALLSVDGRVFVGTNVENASYPLCLCAERGAVSAAIVAGAKKFRAIAIVSNGPPAPPCGGCRQVLAEFGPSFEVRSFAKGSPELRSTVSDLLPSAFSAKYFK